MSDERYQQRQQRVKEKVDARVAQAQDERVPLLERLRFLCIVSSNLDEFFEVRVAGIKQQIESEVVERTMDGLTATETFRAIEPRHNRIVFFWARTMHEVMPVRMPSGAFADARFTVNGWINPA